jgi:hypothetical protein
MNRVVSERIHELCSLIEVEQNRERFLRLVEELNRLLAAEEKGLQERELGKRGSD